MKRLYFDTETSGLPPRGAAVPLEHCPHIVQLAAILVDSDGTELHAINTIIKPDGWVVEQGAADVHGISTERALEVGIPGIIAFGFFSNLAAQADELVAHNTVFDSKLMRWEMERLNKPSHHLTLPQTCTMLLSTPVCKIPGPRGYKWPKLIEAHEKLLGCGFDAAHDALADVRACIRIHTYLIANGHCK